MGVSDYGNKKVSSGKFLWLVIMPPVTNCASRRVNMRNSLAPPAHPGVVLPGQVAGV